MFSQWRGVGSCGLALAFVMACGSFAAAQDEDREEGRNEVKKYWLGIFGVPADEALTTHLGIEKGVLLQEVMPEGPAAKAGLKKLDIVLSFAGKPVGELRDVAEFMSTNKGEPVRVDVLRKGREKTVEIKPEPRPAGIDRAPATYQADADRMLKWMEKLRKGQAGDDPLRMLFVRPGVILPHEHFHLNVPGMMLKELGLPEDCSITVEKQGTDPAKITVRMGGQEWTTTEDKLKSLPDQVRPWVERWLGNRNVYRFSPRANQDRIEDARKRMEEMRRRALDKGDPFEKLNEQIEAMRREIEQLRKAQQEKANEADTADSGADT